MVIGGDEAGDENNIMKLTSVSSHHKGGVIVYMGSQTSLRFHWKMLKPEVEPFTSWLYLYIIIATVDTITNLVARSTSWMVWICKLVLFSCYFNYLALYQNRWMYTLTTQHRSKDSKSVIQAILQIHHHHIIIHLVCLPW